jgi:hypothetical protein
MLLALLALCSSGCVLFGGGPAYTFPPGYEGACHHALNVAEEGIESCGTDIRRTHNLTVELVPGTTKVGDVWAWSSPAFPGILVGGVCYGTRIEVGCNPQTRKEVNFGTLLHETGHHLLMTNHRIRNHPEKYDPVFNWSWVDDYLADNGLRSVYTLDGSNWVHIDFVCKDKETGSE